MNDYHVHTSFSGDCVEPMEASVIQAIKLGLKEICFTDHLDYDYPPVAVEFDFDEAGFTKHFEEISNKYSKDIKILKGIELGLQPHLSKENSDFVKRFKPDFVLGSFHVAEKKDLHTGGFFLDKTPLEAWKSYYKDVYDSLKNFKDYCVVGHLDLPKRYNEAVANVPFDLYKSDVKRVLELIIHDGKGIEVNMSGLRLGNPSLPGRKILELYYELGGKYITFGSDAHRKEDISSHYHPVKEMLMDIGFDYYTTYENMTAIQNKLK